MKVYIIRSTDLGKVRFNNIISSLNYRSNKKRTNPIYYQGICVDSKIDVDIIESDNENYHLLTKRLQDEDDINPLCPDDFNHFFETCDDIRRRENIEENDICILLTNELNTNNFFGWCDDRIKNIMIQTSQWELIFGDDCQYDFAVMYEINAWILRSLFFLNLQHMRLAIGRSHNGDVMDFCVNKEQISIKMRTADISSRLLNQLSQRSMEKYPQISFIIDQFERIRLALLNREKSIFWTTSVTLKFTHDINNNHFIAVEEFGNMNLGLDLSERVIYRLFLQIEEGIHYDNMGLYKKEIYRLFCIESSTKRLTLTILSTIKNIFDVSYTNQERDGYSIVIDKNKEEDLDGSEENELTITVGNTKKNFNEKISKINTTLKRSIPSGIVNDYLIHNNKNKYKVNLDRTLIMY